MGDAYTYTVGFFNLLDGARLEGMWTKIWHISVLQEYNWYSLLNFFVLLFSPFLVKEPFSLAFINFFIFGLSTLSYYRLARHLKAPVPLCIALSFLPWIFPINYGFIYYDSLPVVALDASFFSMLNVALANTLLFSLAPQSRMSAVLAGLAVGFTFGGRGNSLPVVAMVIFPAVVFLAFQAYRQRDRKIWINGLLFGALALTLCLRFYVHYWNGLREYYGVHAEFSKRHPFNFHDGLPHIKNNPGMFFWLYEDQFTTLATILCHVFLIFSIWYVFKHRSSSRKLKEATWLLTLSGSFIYFFTLFFNVIFLSDPFLGTNCLSIYAPMRIGLVLCAFSLFLVLWDRKKLNLNYAAVFGLAGALIMYGVLLCTRQTFRFEEKRPLPQAAERVAVDFEKLVGNGTVSFLWYRYYSFPLLQYYRVKNGLPQLTMYTPPFFSDLWAPVNWGPERRAKVREALNHIFKEANFIVLPESLSLYGSWGPYAFFNMTDEISNILNHPKAPRFVIRLVIQDFGDDRLLIIQRQKEAKGKGVPLPLPYDKNTRAPSGIQTIGLR
jgi:hypothetical protein